MPARIPTVLLAMFLLAAQQPAQGDTAAPIRHLRFTVVSDVRTTITDTIHGFNETGVRPTVTEVHGAADGTIDVDVTGVTSDGLAIRVSEHDAKRPADPLTAGVFNDGYAFMNSAGAQSMNEEELALLPFIAPALFAGHDATTGKSWTLAHTDGTLEHRLDVHVDKTDDNLVYATVKQSIVDRGRASLTQTGQAAVVYNNARTVPLRLTLSLQRSTTTSDRTTRTNLTATYALSDDSMAGR